MTPLAIALISAGAPTVLSLFWGALQHLTTKSHNATVQAVVKTLAPAVPVALTTGMQVLEADGATKAGATAAGAAALTALTPALLSVPAALPTAAPAAAAK